MRKPALVFGEVYFHMIEGITNVNNLEKLPQLPGDFIHFQGAPHACAAYISTVKEYGESVNMVRLGEEGLPLIRFKKKVHTYYRRN